MLRKLMFICIGLSVLLFTACGGGGTLNEGAQTSETNTSDASSPVVLPLVVACVGDSLTEGYGLPDPKRNSYPGQLATLVGEGMQVHNYGISNKTILKKGDDPYWDTNQYEDAKKSHPNIVIIMFGTNDIKTQNWSYKDEFVSDYSELIQAYKHLSSHPTIYVCLPLPTFGEYNGIVESRIVNELIPKIKQVARQNNVDIIDLHTPFVDKNTLLQSDKIHPTIEGAGKMAEIIYNKIH